MRWMQKQLNVNIPNEYTNMVVDNWLFLLFVLRCFFTDRAKTAAAAGQEGRVCHPTHKLFWEAGEYIHGKSGTRPRRESAKTKNGAKTITLYISPHPPAKHPSARDPCYCGAWCWHAICVTTSDSILIQGTWLFKVAYGYIFLDILYNLTALLLFTFFIHLPSKIRAFNHCMDHVK